MNIKTIILIINIWIINKNIYWHKKVELKYEMILILSLIGLHIIDIELEFWCESCVICVICNIATENCYFLYPIELHYI